MVDSAAMTVRDVAVYLKVDEKTVYRLTQDGRLPGFKVAGTWRFKRQDIDLWIEEQKRRSAGADRIKTGSGSGGPSLRPEMPSRSRAAAGHRT